MAPAEPAPAAALLAVEVMWAPAGQPVQIRALQLPAGSTAADALRASGLARELPAGQLDTLALAVWGRVCAPAVALRDGDRVALLRPLLVDPKEARRQRFRRDGVRKPARR